MKRDDDYLRQILFEFEGDEEPFKTFERWPEDEEELREYYHVSLLEDAGLLAVVIDGDHSISYRLHNKGHDFIAAIRDDTRWNRTKELAGKAGTKSLGVLFEIAVALGKQKVTEVTGIELT